MATTSKPPEYTKGVATAVMFVSIVLAVIAAQWIGWWCLCIGPGWVAMYWAGALLAQQESFEFDDWLDTRYG